MKLLNKCSQLLLHNDEVSQHYSNVAILESNLIVMIYEQTICYTSQY